MHMENALFRKAHNPNSSVFKTIKSVNRLLGLALVVSFCLTMGLGSVVASAEDATCTFKSTDTEYYVPAHTTKDISDCPHITLDKPLRIREGATLKGSLSNQLSADTEADFIRMNSGARIETVKVNGQFKADKIITINGQSDVWVVDCVIDNTDHIRGELTGKSQGSHAILISNSQFVHILGNTIRNAGWNPNGNPQASGTKFTAAAVYAWNSKNIEISGNTIRRTLTAGIDFTGSMGVRIIDNDIRDNGLGWVAGINGIADGITAYHNTSASHAGIVDAVIEDNYIKDYRHWGIHVSGRGLTIKDNTVITNPDAGTVSGVDTDRQLSPLVIGDQRNPNPDCSVLVTITGNDLGKPNGEDGKYTHSLFRWGPYDPAELTASYLNANNDLDGAVGGYQRVCSTHGDTDPFSDDNNRYSERSNEWAAVTGLTSGCGDRQVCPTTEIRRKHMALFLYRLLKNRPGFVAPATDANSFSDDDNLGAAYQTAIEWLKANGITKNSGTFNPEGLVPREHMALFMYRAFNKFAEFKPAPGGDSFADTSRYEKEIGWMKANGITSGCGNGQFCPDREVTREQMFIFLHRAATKTAY